MSTTRKTEQNAPAKAEESKNNDLDVHEINFDEDCDVSGGSCAACGSGCSVSPEPPTALHQM